MKTQRQLANCVFFAITISAGLCTTQLASADSSLDTLEALNQAQFVEFSENLSAATSYKSVAPSEPLGIIGFDIGVGLSSTDIDGDLFGLASDGSVDETELILARVQVQKGLPFGLDVGGSLATIPEADAMVIGGELRYAIWDGGVLHPSIGVRASYSQLQGADDLSLRSGGLEVGISKGFLVLTPYASAGIVRSRADAENADNLSSETFTQRKVVLGVTINLGVAVTLEVDRTGGFRTYSAKAGLRF